MKVKYKIVDQESYDRYCYSVLNYPRSFDEDELLLNIDDFTIEGTGIILTYIMNKNQFLILDDKTNKFLRINIECCERIDASLKI